MSALTAALSAMTRHLAEELAPIRVNVIAAGFVDNRSAEVLGEGLEARRDATSFAPPCRSDASSARLTSPLSRYTS
jgi:NAD(P)-dependent dehydrogenase (short-subunit alcohol dehydrogenase family)